MPVVSRLAVCALLLPLAACGKEVPKTDKAWVRLPAVAGHPAAGYFELRGGPKDDRLVAVDSPDAQRIELHSNMMHGGMMQMRPLDGVALPANGRIAFEPSGNHAMIFGVSDKVKPGGTMTLRFKLGSGATAEARAKVIAAGDVAPD